MSKEALKLAMEALDGLYMPGELERVNKAILAIKQALEQPVQPLPFGVGGGLVAIKTLLSRDPCVHANTAIEMIDAILAEQPAAVQEPVAILNHAHGVYAFRSVNLQGLPDGEYQIYTTPPTQEFTCSTGLCHYKPASPVQPVASVPIHPKTGPLWAMTTDKPDPERLPSYPLMALYTNPPAAQRPWVDLTDEQRSAISRHHPFAYDIIRVTAAKLKELNT